MPPLYGRWHAAAKRLLYNDTGAPLPTTGNWLHQLNLDPRHRVAAAAGTAVIQKGQEDYMDAAWSQVGDVLAANQALRHAAFAMQVSIGWHERRLGSARDDADRYLRLTRPAHRRILSNAETVRAAFDKSRISASFMSSTTSRCLRPGGRLARLGGGVERLDKTDLIAGLNTGKLVMVPLKAPPQGVTTLDVLMKTSIPAAIKGRLANVF